MSASQREKGENYLKEADELLSKGGGACCGGGGSSRTREEQAADIYIKAGNSFKAAKEWQKAGNAFSEAAHLQLKNDRKTESGMNYVEAAKCYKKVSPTECEQSLMKASEIYSDVGRGKTAAKQHLTLAELYEEQGNLKQAVEEFQKAADMFSGEELTSSTTKCLLSVANHSASLGDYDRAQNIFIELGNASINNKLLKYTACEHFSKAGLCHLASRPQDGPGLLAKIEEFRDTSPAFAESRECTWLVKMAEAGQKEDIEAFNDAIRTYESVTRLGEWENNLLKVVRRHIGPDLR